MPFIRIMNYAPGKFMIPVLGCFDRQISRLPGAESAIHIQNIGHTHILKGFGGQAERQLLAQNRINSPSVAKISLWYGLSGSAQNSSIPRGHERHRRSGLHGPVHGCHEYRLGLRCRRRLALARRGYCCGFGFGLSQSIFIVFLSGTVFLLI